MKTDVVCNANDNGRLWKLSIYKVFHGPLAWDSGFTKCGRIKKLAHEIKAIIV